MPSNVEKIWEESETHFGENYKCLHYRTTCKCLSDDHDLTFHVNVDVEQEHVEQNDVYLDVSINTYQLTDVWNTPAWSRPFRSFWQRLKVASKVILTGCVKMEGSFIFRGNEQIDEFVETIVEAQNLANKTQKQILEDKEKGVNVT